MTVLDHRANARTTFDEIVLSDEARDQLRVRLLDLNQRTTDPDRYQAALVQAFAELPLDTFTRLLDAGRHSDTAGLTLLSNLPTDPFVPPTPVDGGPSPDKDTFVSEGVMLGLSGLVGEPFGVLSEKAGQLVHDVIPVKAGATTQTNQGSAVFLNFHNDIIHDESGYYTMLNPDFLVLGCIRSDPEGKALTHYADARDVVNRLQPDHVQTLRQAQFRLNAPGSYCRSVGQGQVYSELVPIISGPDAFPEISFSANGVIAMTTAGTNALDALQLACREVSHTVALKPGDALIINNRKGLHARTAFEARHDGTDRWLQRTYVCRTLWPARHRMSDEGRRVF